MSIVKLKKLINRAENIKAIEDTVKLLDTKIVIEDAKEVIYGNKEVIEGTKKYNVTVNDEVIGWVIGNEKAECIASILHSICINEYEKKKLAKETLEKYKEINMFYDVSEKLASTTRAGNVAKIVINEAMKHLNITFASIVLVNEETQVLETICQVHKNINLENGKLKVDLSINNEFIKNIISRKTGEIIDNVKEVEGLACEGYMLNSLICAPILAKGKAIGIMLLGNDKVYEYTAADLKLSNSLAYQTGIAIEGTKLYEQLRENFFDTIQVLTQIIEMRDNFKGGHSKRVANYSLNIAKAMEMSKIDLVKLKLAVMLHDIGNVAVSDEILNRKGKLPEEQYEIVKKHSEIGAIMLDKIEQLKDIAPAIRAHHERYDGTGYPDNLKGEEIPLFARIIAVADAFEAMTNDRPYREALNLYFAAEELSNNKGTQFDPRIVDIFFEIYKDKKLEEIQTSV
ncbi:HD domain-containing protein [Clostridium sp. YIM B02515]|uniref:HD domain-containing protein n=1 Tax=Clostridium rhizosphaerae TaxID=2803861 RepID=A0ABS1TAK7_9CLOT|nr:HD domain-containing phosphohydrolase [Clostridium rhizosphaerae]MBL4936391.1 HD domain-containing protein [Clostridium rhizosphaerae]